MATSAITDTQKVDLLFKKNFGYGRTAANVSTTAEVVASPPPLRGDLLWLQADKILLAPGPVKDIVVEHKGDTAVKLVPATTNKLAGSTTDIFQAYRANDGTVDLKNWISADFGAQYSPVLYMVDADTVPSNLNPGTLLSPDGTGGDGQWVFDCQSGVLNFINNTIPGIKLAPSPNTFTDQKTLYLRAYRYVGTMGVQNLAVQGPPGPAGPAGPDGISGPSGPVGPSGPLQSGVNNGNYLYWNASASAWVVGGDESVYLGKGAGVDSGAAGPGNVAIGTATAPAGQHKDAIAIGRGAGTASVLDAQSEAAVAIGALAGSDAGQGSVAIGAAAGYSNGVYGVSVGSASQSIGSSAVSVGYGATATGNNSIVINATGVQLTAATASTCCIAPIASATSTTGLNALCYNPATFEVVATAPSYLYASNARWESQVNTSSVVHFDTYVSSPGWTVITLPSAPPTSTSYFGNRYTCIAPGVYVCTFTATIRVSIADNQISSIGIEVVSGALRKEVGNSAVSTPSNRTSPVTVVCMVELLAGDSIQCACNASGLLTRVTSTDSAGSFTAVRIGGITPIPITESA
jgi:hypothetical protein